VRAPNYEIIAAWTRSETPEEIAPKFLRTLDELESIDPRLRDWVTSDELVGGPMYPIPRDGIVAWITSQMRENGMGELDPKAGYALMAVSEHGAASGLPVCIMPCPGGLWRSTALFEIGMSEWPPKPGDITYSLYKAVLLTIVSIWMPPWANARCSIWGKPYPKSPPGVPPFPYSGYQMPWISYLNADRAAKVDVSPEVATERTPDGGLLMVATEERFDPTNPNHMRPSRLMAQIMIDHAGDPDY
jgi:hypothetical protein